ncbi:MAG: NAD(+)/NADH kinase [Kiritimatiellia bacterium]
MIDVAVDGEWVASYVCDGLIVATPVGSTGHALSAGGPILHREIPAILLEPICPHTLSNRPLVLPNDRKITIRLPAQDKHLLLSVDGRPSGWLKTGDLLEIRKSPLCAHFVQLPNYSWFKLLSQKLHWRGSSSDPK